MTEEKCLKLTSEDMKCLETMFKKLEQDGPEEYPRLMDWIVYDQAFDKEVFEKIVLASIEFGYIRHTGSFPFGRQSRIYLTYGEAPISRTVETWNYAMGWCRDNGAEIRNGKVTRTLARARIYKAGLMHEFNRAWPEYSFNEREAEEAIRYLESEERKKTYAKKQRFKNKGIEWKVRG